MLKRSKWGGGALLQRSGIDQYAARGCYRVAWYTRNREEKGLIIVERYNVLCPNCGREVITSYTEPVPSWAGKKGLLQRWAQCSHKDCRSIFSDKEASRIQRIP
jgi:hypothetical protein